MSDLGVTTTLKPMDVYADMSIPFDVATYCRGHKFAPESHTLTRAIKHREAMREALREAEKNLEHAENHLKERIEVARKRMEKDSHV